MKPLATLVLFLLAAGLAPTPAAAQLPGSPLSFWFYPVELQQLAAQPKGGDLAYLCAGGLRPGSLWRLDLAWTAEADGEPHTRTAAPVAVTRGYACAHWILDPATRPGYRSSGYQLSAVEVQIVTVGDPITGVSGR